MAQQRQNADRQHAAVTIDRGEPGSGRRWPDFYIVGAPKCGTTAMYQYLRQHPQIFMPFQKEPLYFGEDLTRRYGRLTEQEYLALFRDAQWKQIVGEASAWYLYSRTAAREIGAVSPRALIVVMVRNPVEVMYAQHSQLLFNRQEDIADFGEALAAEADRRAGRRLPRGPIRPENLYYREMVRFADQLERYLEVFGRERVRVIVHEDMRADVSAVYQSLAEFLGVEPSYRPRFEPVNENKRVRLQQLQQLIYDPPLIRRLIPYLRRYPLVHRLRAGVLELNSRRTVRPPLNAELHRQLAAELGPEIEHLGRLLDRDLSAWTSSPAAVR